jgi:hypothetical protein
VKFVLYDVVCPPYAAILPNMVGTNYWEVKTNGGFEHNFVYTIGVYISAGLVAGMARILCIKYAGDGALCNT